MHDVGHDGLNNGYHKRAMSKRALAFNDIRSALPTSKHACLCLLMETQATVVWNGMPSAVVDVVWRAVCIWRAGSGAC
eukprot:581821-Rhodomonas_salina.1